jgi:hypothetical protein
VRRVAVVWPSYPCQHIFCAVTLLKFSQRVVSFKVLLRFYNSGRYRNFCHKIFSLFILSHKCYKNTSGFLT